MILKLVVLQEYIEGELMDEDCLKNKFLYTSIYLFIISKKLISLPCSQEIDTL